MTVEAAGHAALIMTQFSAVSPSSNDSFSAGNLSSLSGYVFVCAMKKEVRFCAAANRAIFTQPAVPVCTAAKEEVLLSYKTQEPSPSVLQDAGTVPFCLTRRRNRPLLSYRIVFVFLQLISAFKVAKSIE